MSGKPFATAMDYGSITKSNAGSIAYVIYKSSGIEIDCDYLLNKAPMYRIDVKKDIIVDEDPCYYISEFREVLKRCTDKFDVNKYSEIKYDSGLTVIPKTQDNCRFSMYIKGTELRKPRNKEYRSVFDFEFLEQANKTIRCEYQMRKFEDMRNAFGLEYSKTPILSEILNSQNDVVADIMSKLMEE